MKKYLFSLIFGMSFLMTACANESNESFDVFYSKVKSCQELSVKTNEKCEAVIKTWQEVSPIIEMLQENPQLLGVKLIEIQNQLANTKNAQKKQQLLEKKALYYKVVRWFESPVA